MTRLQDLSVVTLSKVTPTGLKKTDHTLLATFTCEPSKVPGCRSGLQQLLESESSETFRVHSRATLKEAYPKDAEHLLNGAEEVANGQSSIDDVLDTLQEKGNVMSPR